MIKSKKGTSIAINRIVILTIVVAVLVFALVFMYSWGGTETLRNQAGYGTPDDKDIEIYQEVVSGPPCSVRVGLIKDKEVYMCNSYQQTVEGEDPGRYCNENSITKLGDVEYIDAKKQDLATPLGGALRIVTLGAADFSAPDGKADYAFVIPGKALSGQISGEILGYVKNGRSYMALEKIDAHQTYSYMRDDAATMKFLHNLHGAYILGNNWICRNNIVNWESPFGRYRFGEGSSVGYSEGNIVLDYDNIDKYVVDAADARKVREYLDKNLGDTSKPLPVLTESLLRKYLKSKGFDGVYYYRAMDIFQCKGLGKISLYIDSGGQTELAESYLDKDGNLILMPEKYGRNYTFLDYDKFKAKFDNRGHWDWIYYAGEESVKNMGYNNYLGRTNWNWIKGGETIPNAQKQLLVDSGGDEMVKIQWERVDVSAWSERKTFTEHKCRGEPISGTKIYVRIGDKDDEQRFRGAIDRTPFILQDMLNWITYGESDDAGGLIGAYVSLVESGEDIYWLADSVGSKVSDIEHDLRSYSKKEMWAGVNK